MSWLTLTIVFVLACFAGAFAVSEWLARRGASGSDDTSAMG